MGNPRKASNILLEQKQNIINETEKFNTLSEMVSLVNDMKKYLLESNLDKFGLMLHKNWQLKKSLSNQISATDIDDIYELGLKNGAIGGKLLGAGGGGFILFLVKKDSHNIFKLSLPNPIKYYRPPPCGEVVISVFLIIVI